MSVAAAVAAATRATHRPWDATAQCRTEGHLHAVPDTEADTGVVSPVCIRCGRDDEAEQR